MSTDGSHTVSSAHQMRRVVVVGAGLAGLRACQTLRDRGYDGALTLFGAESHLPYDRPPLSKQVLAGTWKPEQADLKGGESLGDLGVEVRLETTATALDAGARELTLKGGERIGFDGLVVATGANARLLPGITGRPNVLTLRTIEDCLELRRVLERPGARLVLAGGGFIGLEVAATARRLGAEVAVVEPLSVPLERTVGPLVGGVVEAMHRDEGVELHLGESLEAVDTDQDGTGVRCRLKSGDTVEGDVLLVGIGAVPSVAWLDGSGLDIDESGLRCDAALVAGDRIVAAGDLASWPHPVIGERVRVEHRTNAGEQGEHAAGSLLASPTERRAFSPVHYVWSDQYEHKLQVLGAPGATDEAVVVEGSIEERRFVVAYGRDGRLTGVVGLSRPRALMAFRPLLETPASFEEAVALTQK